VKTERLRVGSRTRWNTGRTYTSFGQRIAAQSVGDCVVMVDIDRGIEYLIQGCPLSVGDVMRRYDSNDRCGHVPSMYRPIVKSLQKWAAKQ